MASVAWAEVRLAVGGALRLAVGDRRGLGAFDASIDGFWRSFRAAFLCYPLYLFLFAMRLPSAAQSNGSGVATIIVVQTIAYAIAWVAFPLLILPLSRWLGRAERFLAFMVVYNWSQIPQSALFAIVALVAAIGLLPRSAFDSAEFVATVATLIYEWYSARVALAVGGAQALLIVVLDLVLGGVLGRIAEALY
jgi:hypothetical protein